VQLPDDLPAPTDPRLRSLLDVQLAMLDLAGRLEENWNAHAAMHGVSGAQIKVLLSLRGDDAVPMNEVATRLDYDASNLTSLVERLRSRGLLERTDDVNDRRRKTLRLTPAGLKLRDGFWNSLTSGSGPMADMSHADLKRLARLLGREPSP
jgi:DNA-binding MarR family transcriptional regulator